MKFKWVLICFVFFTLCVMSLAAKDKALEESSLDVVLAHRMVELQNVKPGGILQEEEGFTSKNREKDVVLALRVKGISYEDFSDVQKNKEIYVTDGENQHRSEISMFVTMVSGGAFKKFCLLVFVVPKTTLEFKLVMGNSSVDFKADAEIVDKMRMDDLKK